MTATTVLDTATRLRRVSGRLARQLRTRGGIGLTASQLSILYSVSEHAELTLTDLARFEGVSPPTASRGVDGLVELGLLTRRTDATDARRHLLTLTGQARTLLSQGHDLATGALADQLAGLPADSLAAIEEALPALQELVAEISRHRAPCGR